MALDIHVKDPASGKVARVLNGGALEVISDNLPAQGLEQKAFIFRQFFKNGAGSELMNIDGSTTPQEFVIKAPVSSTTDRYITSLSFLIEDASMRLGDRFGGLAALTNGVDVEYSNNLAEGGVVSLSLEGVKTNFGLIRLCLGNPAFGDNTTAFQAGFSAADSAYMPVLDFRAYGLSHGIVLRGKTGDQVKIRINDNLTGLTNFTCVGAGFDRVSVG